MTWRRRAELPAALGARAHVALGWFFSPPTLRFKTYFLRRRGCSDDVFCTDRLTQWVQSSYWGLVKAETIPRGAWVGRGACHSPVRGPEIEDCGRKVAPVELCFCGISIFFGHPGKFLLWIIHLALHQVGRVVQMAVVSLHQPDPQQRRVEKHPLFRYSTLSQAEHYTQILILH